jgi:hypothetical protein
MDLAEQRGDAGENFVHDWARNSLAGRVRLSRRKIDRARLVAADHTARFQARALQADRKSPSAREAPSGRDRKDSRGTEHKTETSPGNDDRTIPLLFSPVGGFEGTR